MNVPTGIFVGDVIEFLKSWPAKFIHLCVSSPPYWNLRDYKVKPTVWPEIRFRLNEWSPETVVPEMTCCLGLEPDPVTFVGHLLYIYRLIRPCLRDDALVFVNLGDSFCKSGGKGGGNTGRPGRQFKQVNIDTKPAAGLKAKDLVGVPWLFANAMRADGWFFRGESIWCKRSPMPESVDGSRWEQHRIKVADVDFRRADVGYGMPSGWNTSHKEGADLVGNHNGTHKRKIMAPCPGCPKCSPNNGLIFRRGNWRHTRGHEYVFQFAKSKYAFSDAQAVAEPVSGGAHARGKGLNPKAADDKGDSRDRQNADFSTSVTDLVLTRNPRSFYVLSTEPSKEKHFAAYPKKLILPFIKAGTSAGGYCNKCGAPVCRVVERVRVPTQTGKASKVNPTVLDPDSPYSVKMGDIVGNRDPQRHVTEKRTVGWRRTCQCQDAEFEPAIVFDPFFGTGTTGVVAKSLGFRFLGTEVNPQYAEIAARKIENAGPHQETVESRPRKKATASKEQLELFT